MSKVDQIRDRLNREPKEPTPDRPDERADEDAPDEEKFIRIESDVLGDTFVYVKDKQWYLEAKEKFPGEVLYFDPELDELQPFREDHEFLRAVHNLKKAFKGFVIPTYRKDREYSELKIGKMGEDGEVKTIESDSLKSKQLANRIRDRMFREGE